jgi:hypothetical protein
MLKNNHSRFLTALLSRCIFSTLAIIIFHSFRGSCWSCLDCMVMVRKLIRQATAKHVTLTLRLPDALSNLQAPHKNVPSVDEVAVAIRINVSNVLAGNDLTLVMRKFCAHSSNGDI